MAFKYDAQHKNASCLQLRCKVSLTLMIQFKPILTKQSWLHGTPLQK